MHQSGYFNTLLKFKIHHILFWVVYYFGWIQVYKEMYSDAMQLYLITLIYGLSHAFMYYVTQYVLIPKFLKKKKLFFFISALIILLFVSVLFMFFAIDLVLLGRMVEFFGGRVLPIVMFFASSNVFILATMMSIKMIFDRYRNQRNEERKEKERLEAELQYLKAQVNPHFLFNTINSVYVLIGQDPKKASETLIKLSDLLRAQLYDFGSQSISIEQELNYLENYVELERMRKGDKLDFKITIGENLKGFCIAPLILLPFLENCFKHVSADFEKKNRISVSLDVLQDQLSAHFFNTKETGAEQLKTKVGGIGLKNVKRRLELIYKDEYELDINNSKDFFQVDLKLNINNRHVL